MLRALTRLAVVVASVAIAAEAAFVALAGWTHRYLVV
jgi:hypothetical protein